MSYSIGFKFSTAMELTGAEWASTIVELAKMSGIPGFSGAYLVDKFGHDVANRQLSLHNEPALSLIRPAVGMTRLMRPNPFIGIYIDSDATPESGKLFASGRDDKSIYSVTALLVVVAAARLLSVRAIEDYSSVWCGKGRFEFDANENMQSLLYTGGIDILSLSPV